jgi:hypothetical protein
MQLFEQEMLALDEERAAGELKPPNTLTVLGLLVGAAFVFSWLGSYAVTDALIASGVLNDWRPGTDPRPSRMAASFVGLLVSFVSVAVVLKWFSSRQLRRIDRTADDE